MEPLDIKNENVIQIKDQDIIKIPYIILSLMEMHASQEFMELKTIQLCSKNGKRNRKKTSRM